MTSEASIRKTILGILGDKKPGGTISPDEVARALAGADPKAWSRLMPAIRRAAVALADEGAIAIRRKGKDVDPHDFKGVYRLGPPG